MPHRWIAASAVLTACVLLSPALASAQSGWSEPLQPKAPPSAPAEPPPPPMPDVPAPEPPAVPAPSEVEPNADWSDAPPTEYEERSPQNPDWVEEDEPPPIANKPERASEVYGIRYANRRLTMPRGMMRGTVDTVVGRRVDENVGSFEPFGETGTIATTNLGVALAIADDIEIGFSRYRMGSYPPRAVFPDLGFGPSGLVSMVLAPDVKYGDIPLYARFQPLDTGVSQLAIDASFRIPSRTEFGFSMGVPLRFVAKDAYAFDTGINFSVENNPNGPSIWSLGIPFSFVANATDQFFIKVDSGIEFFDLSGTVSTATSGLVNGPFYFIPLGFGGGYTVGAERGMFDIFASFRFPTLYGFTASASEVRAETWAVTIGLNIYSPVLFKGGGL
ncbi:MAG: hypothetical protein AAF436_08700 [Myxococcota bacterium]